MMVVTSTLLKKTLSLCSKALSSLSGTQQRVRKTTSNVLAKTATLWSAPATITTWSPHQSTVSNPSATSTKCHPNKLSHNSQCRLLCALQLWVSADVAVTYWLWVACLILLSRSMILRIRILLRHLRLSCLSSILNWEVRTLTRVVMSSSLLLVIARSTSTVWNTLLWRVNNNSSKHSMMERKDRLSLSWKSLSDLMWVSSRQLTCLVIQRRSQLYLALSSGTCGIVCICVLIKPKCSKFHLLTLLNWNNR